MIRGKNLGGCTAHYGMAYHRGNPRNYKHWLDLGNKGWSYEDVSPNHKYHPTGNMKNSPTHWIFFSPFLSALFSFSFEPKKAVSNFEMKFYEILIKSNKVSLFSLPLLFFSLEKRFFQMAHRLDKESERRKHARAVFKSSQSQKIIIITIITGASRIGR